MPLGMMTSKAEMRSLATKRRLSPRSKISRTLPLLIFLMPGSSSCRTVFGKFDMGGIIQGGRRNSSYKVTVQRFLTTEAQRTQRETSRKGTEAQKGRLKGRKTACWF